MNENEEGQVQKRKTLPSEVHVTRWCPMCQSEMHFEIDEDFAVHDSRIVGLYTVCNNEKCDFFWPLVITQSTEKRTK